MDTSKLRVFVSQNPMATGVVVTSLESHESKGDGAIETETYTLIFQENGRYWETVYRWYKDYRKGSSESFGMVSKNEISAEVYRGLTSGAGFEDVARATNELRRRQEIQAEFKRMNLSCPKCAAAMELKLNSGNGTKFWGCTNFGRKGCKGTRNVTQHQLNLLDELRRLI